MVELYHNKGIDMLKLTYSLLNLTNVYLHSSTSANCHPFTENDIKVLSKVPEDMVGRPSKVFTHKTIVERQTIASPKMFAYRLLEQMLANITLIHCVNICLQDSTQDISLMQICKKSSRLRSNIETSKVWSSRSFNE